MRNFKRFTWVEWVFIAVGLVAFLFSVSLTIERFVHFGTNFNGSSESFQAICHPQDSTTNCIDACTNWSCLSDVTFAIALLVNLCKRKSNTFVKLLPVHGQYLSMCLHFACIIVLGH